ncbi:hypothetical protein OROMI_006219 [Orobanche minor]
MLRRVLGRFEQVSALFRKTAGQNGPRLGRVLGRFVPRHVVGKIFHDVLEFISATNRSITTFNRPNQGSVFLRRTRVGTLSSVVFFGVFGVSVQL